MIIKDSMGKYTIKVDKVRRIVKENCVRCYMERTKKYRIWFQAASELRWPNTVFKSLCLILHNF